MKSAQTALQATRGLFMAMVVACPLSGMASDELYYRYQDDQGNIAIDDHVPPALAKNGYTVINRNGRVIEEVPRALSDDEKKNANSGAVQAQLRAEERARQLRYDENLLRRYSDVVDIEDARRRKVNDVMVRINLLNSNISSLSEQIAILQGQAAELERDGQPVPESVDVNLRTLREEIASTKRMIEARRKDQEVIEARFEYDKQRFSELRAPVPPAPPEASRALN